MSKVFLCKGSFIDIAVALFEKKFGKFIFKYLECNFKRSLFNYIKCVRYC